MLLSKHVLYADSEHSLVLSKHSRSYEKTSASELIVLFIIRNTAIDHVMVTSPNPASHVLILILTCGYKDNCMYVTYVVGTGHGNHDQSPELVHIHCEVAIL